MRRLFRPFAVLTLVALAALAPPAFALDMGDDAPEIDVTEWVTGSPVDFEAAKSKFVHVVAFFVTFEEGSQKAFKQLADVHAKYKEKGLRCFVVCDQTPEDAKKWITENPQPYPVAADPRKNTVAPYMKGESAGPPFVFIVGKEGTVYWKGNPTVGFEDVLEKVMSGKYDAKHETAVAEAREALYKQWRKGNPADIEPAADALLDLEPADSEALSLKLRLVQRVERGETADPTKFHDFCSAHLPKVQDNAEALNQFAWTLATHASFEYRKPKLALETAKQAVKVSKGENAGIVDTLARVYFEVGMLQRAVETQKQAVAAAKEDDQKKDLKKTADYYEKCLKVMQSERK